MHYAVPIARRFKQDLHNTAWGQDLFTFANQISPTLQANLEHNAAKRLTHRANMAHFSTLLSNAITRAYQTEVYQQDPRPPSLLPYTHTENPPQLIKGPLVLALGGSQQNVPSRSIIFILKGEMYSMGLFAVALLDSSKCWRFLQRHVSFRYLFVCFLTYVRMIFHSFFYLFLLCITSNFMMIWHLLFPAAFFHAFFGYYFLYSPLS